MKKKIVNKKRFAISMTIFITFILVITMALISAFSSEDEKNPNTVDSTTVITNTDFAPYMEYAIVVDDGIAENNDGEKYLVPPYPISSMLLIIHVGEDMYQVKNAEYELAEGETIWDVAELYCGDIFDISEYMESIMYINNIHENEAYSGILFMPTIKK